MNSQVAWTAILAARKTRRLEDWEYALDKALSFRDHASSNQMYFVSSMIKECLASMKRCPR